jgi:hypothetical protein
MTNSFAEISNNEYENRIKVYELYIEIKEEIIGKKIEIESNNYEELIIRTEIPTIINYIKESIPILIKRKLEEEKKKIKNEKKINFKENDFFIYENQIKKLENDLRNYIKQILIYKIQKDSFEKTLRNYMEMEIEFEELKEKLKYDGGEFLNNDRKENEIEILRRENSNLKNEIIKLELEKKNSDILISNYHNEIEKLNKKISELNEFNSVTVSSSKKNYKNKNHKSLNLIIKQNISSSFRNKKNKNAKHNNSLSYDLKSPKSSFHENKKKKNNISNHHNNEGDIFTKIIGEKKKIKKQKKIDDSNKKIDIVKKYFSYGINYNQSNNNNYSYLRYNKITSAIPSSKFSLRRDKKNNFSLSTININNSKKTSKSGNRSLLNLKSTSKEY